MNSTLFSKVFSRVFSGVFPVVFSGVFPGVFSEVFPLDFFIKYLWILHCFLKCFLRYSLGCSLGCSLGVLWAVSFRFPFWILIQNAWNIALVPPGQFPSHVLLKSLSKCLWNGSDATFNKDLIRKCKGTAQEAPEAFPYVFNKDLIRKCKGNCPAGSRSIFHMFCMCSMMT